jgi:hypothetical protein
MTKISEQEAIDATTNWRSFNASNTINENAIDTYLPKAYTLPMADIQAILSQQGVAGIRVYFGYKSAEPAPQGPDNFPMQLIAVGVDGDGKDMLTAGEIYDRFEACPKGCDSTSVLCV